MFDIQENLKKLPDRPGVYIHKDSLGEVIYVGKALSLKNRVRQYFQSAKNQEPKVRAMVSNIAEFEYIVTGTEMEALILECNLIKKYKPKYNILLRDDKSYPYIKVTMAEKWPRVLKTRKVINDGSKYFGPYTDVMAVNNIVDFLNGFLQLKGCSQRSFPKGSKPCLNYHINRCKGFCCIDDSNENIEQIKKEYGESVATAIDFLSGRSKKIIDRLTEKMEIASAQLKFEEAGILRDQISSMRALSQKQSIVKTEAGDMDAAIYLSNKEQSHVVIFFVRQGKLMGRESFKMDGATGESGSRTVREFINQYYTASEIIPDEILIEEQIEDKELIEERLSALKGKKVNLQVPKRGHKKALLDLAVRDTAILADTIEEKEKNRNERLRKIESQLRHVFGFPIERIEAYDISNISGVDSVGAMVVFEKGSPVKKDFRKFKIKTVEGADDFASMKEVITRRFKRYLNEDKGFSILPDIIFMDGGKPQITAATQALEGLGMDIPVAGMVKDDKHRTRGILWQGKEYDLKEHSLLFKYVTAIQDKVHEFAIEYHTGIRNRSLEKSILDEIRGVGKTRKENLLRAFGSIENIKKASLEELVSIEGIDRKTAKAVFEFFTGDQST